MNQLLAAIDLGTNTVRLLIGCPEQDGSIRPLLLKRHITRLGGGFTKERGISDEAAERTLTALIEFAEDMRQRGVERVRAVATSAVRDAANREEFCSRIRSSTGISLEVIDGEEEGRLTLDGVLSGLDTTAGNFLVFDVGGGSTEYTVARDREALFTRSLPLGVVRLAEGKGSSAAMTDKVVRELALLSAGMREAGLLPMPSDSTLVGTAGTATTLAAIDMGMTEYDYRRVNNYTLGIDRIRSIRDRLLPLAPSERLQVPGMERGREDLIIAGIFITLGTMEHFGFTRLKISDFGLLEGVLHSMPTSIQVTKENKLMF